MQCFPDKFMEAKIYEDRFDSHKDKVNFPTYEEPLQKIHTLEVNFLPIFIQKFPIQYV
jgi:hypothetical protein